MGICYSEDRSKKMGNINKLSALPRTGTVLSTTSTNDPKMFEPISPLTIKDDIQIYYKFSESIKKGNFGLIQEAYDPKTNKKFAVKTIWKKVYPQEKLQALKSEIGISLSLNHKNIRRCYEAYEDANSVHLVLELAFKGDLLDYIINCETGYLREDKAAYLFSQLLEGIEYLHKNNIVHRDIKLENCLLFEENDLIVLKIIDFGFAVHIDEGGLSDKLGSVPYMAPEIFIDPFYDEKVDIWASGIILYNMLTGRQPFFGESEAEIMDKIINYEFLSFNDERWADNSSHAKELLKCLMMKESFDRPSAEFARKHKWFSQFTEEKTSISKKILSSFGMRKDIANEVWNLCIKHLETSEALKVKEFLIAGYKGQEIDKNLSKSIIKFETFVNGICQFCQNNIIKTSLQGILQRRICQGQKIDFLQFFDDFERFKIESKRTELWKIFKSIDKNNKGVVNSREVIDCLKGGKCKYSFPNIEDRRINFEKFVSLLDTTCSRIIIENDTA